MIKKQYTRKDWNINCMLGLEAIVNVFISPIGYNVTFGTRYLHKMLRG